MPPSVVCFGYVALFIGVVAAIVVGIAVYALGLVFGKKVFKGNVWLKSLPIAGIAALVVGCGIFWVLGDTWMSSFYPPSPSRRPSEQDIVGIWQLTQDSRESIQEDAYEITTHTLDFRLDGTFSMTNLPDLVWNFDEPRGQFESGSGRWSIERDVNRDWSIAVHFTELNGNADDFRKSYFYLYGKEPPYLIYDYIGDPDSGRILTFEKATGKLEN